MSGRLTPANGELLPACSDAPESGTVDPRQVITRSRLDVILKYLYFRSLVAAEDEQTWELFYRRHILDRTNGFEPRDLFQKQPSAKHSVEDYVAACKSLLRSFQSSGFDPKYPVPLAPDQKLLNGAHRIACALATQNSIRVAPVQLGCRSSWGFRWFLERGYPADLTAALLYHYAHLTMRSTGVMILWGPALPHWPAIKAELKGHVGLVGWQDLSFEENPSAFESIVHDIYALQWKDLDHANIRRKIILLNQSRRAFRVLLVEDLGHDGTKFAKKVSALRAKIRKSLSCLVPKESFCTCHAAFAQAEANYLIELLLGPGSRKLHTLRSRGQPRRELNKWLFRLADELRRLGLSRHDVCIVGSTPLEIVGIRNATDIDLTVASCHRKRFGKSITHLNQWLDIVTQGYARSIDHRRISDDELISDSKHHFWFRGYKFANIEIVLRRKAYQKRPKDLADVKAAKRFFSKPASDRFRPSGSFTSDLIGYLVGREKELTGGRL